MFDVTESIEDKYLWNFSSRDAKCFRYQHLARQRALRDYEAKVHEFVVTDNPAIFANYEPRPSTLFEIKYTLNRISANDPRETELRLSYLDPPSSQKIPYAKSISWAFEDNTHCQTVILNGVRTQEKWCVTRGFNDSEADQILDVLSTKKLKEFSFTSYPLLTDVTYLKIANILAQPKNRWQHVTLGKIPVAWDIADSYEKSGRVSFTRIVKPKHRSFLSFFMNREKSNERG